MSHRVSDEEMLRFSEFIARAIGMNFPPPRWLDLRRGVEATVSELGLADTDEYIRRILSSAPTKAELESLIGHLTVGETYFFREPQVFEVLTTHILPALVRARTGGERRLRIWSAACCTGEEPYSIAIALQRAIPDWREWEITLLATDLNQRFLRKAPIGIFGQWSFRGTPAWVKQRYFHATPDGQFEILPEIKKLVRFANVNLVEDAYPSLLNDTSAMDVIFCRNVLMYFTASQAGKVMRKLYEAQGSGGWLIVSPSELAHSADSPYRAVNLGGTLLYRRLGSERQTEPLFLLPAKVPKVEIAAESLEPCSEALVAEVPKPETLEFQARAFANEGRLAEALACCDQWIVGDKLNPIAHYLQAVILQEQDRIDAAIQSLRAAMYLDPVFVLPHVALGNIARGRGNRREADKHRMNALWLLARYRPEEILPESEGMTAGRLSEIIESLASSETTT